MHSIKRVEQIEITPSCLRFMRVQIMASWQSGNHHRDLVSLVAFLLTALHRQTEDLSLEPLPVTIDCFFRGRQVSVSHIKQSG